MQDMKGLSSKIVKMMLWIAGALFAGFIGGILLSLFGRLLEMAFTFNPESLLPATVGYVLGFLLGIPLGTYFIGNLIYRRKCKLIFLFSATVLGFLIFLAYYLFSNSENIIPLIFFTLFHAGPWVLTSFSGLIFMPKPTDQIQ